MKKVYAQFDVSGEIIDIDHAKRSTDHFFCGQTCLERLNESTFYIQRYLGTIEF